MLKTKSSGNFCWTKYLWIALLKNNSAFCNGCKISLRLELKPHVKNTYIFRQIEILDLDKLQMFNIVRIALRGWFKTAYYVLAKKTTLWSCPEGLRKVLFKRQIDCRTYRTEWQLLIVFDIFLRSPVERRVEFIRTFSTYFRKYEKGFNFCRLLCLSEI